MEQGSHGTKTVMEHMLHTRDIMYSVGILEESMTDCQLPREEIEGQRAVFRRERIG
jgi:hypothetical protein